MNKNKPKYKYPKNEKVWIRYLNTHGDLMFIATSKPQRDCYYLYELIEIGEFIKLGRGKNTLELEEKFDVETKLQK